MHNCFRVVTICLRCIMNLIFFICYSSQSQIESYLKSIKETAAAASVIEEPAKKKRKASSAATSTPTATSVRYGEFTIRLCLATVMNCKYNLLIAC